MIECIPISFGIFGPPSPVLDNALVTFDGTTARKIQASAVTIDDAGNVARLGTLATAAGTLTINETASLTDYHTDSRAALWLAAGHEATYNHPNYDTAYGWGDHAGLYDPAGTMTTHEITYAHADIALNTTHRGSTGADHGYIDQSVISGANVTFGTIGCGTITLTNGSSINLQEDITFTGATTENQILFPDNLANALSFQEAGNIYQQFITTNGSEAVYFGEKVGIGTTTPFNLFHIKKSAVTGADQHADDLFVLENTGGGNMNFITSSNDNPAFVFSDDTRAVGGFRYEHPSDRFILWAAPKTLNSPQLVVDGTRITTTVNLVVAPQNTGRVWGLHEDDVITIEKTASTHINLVTNKLYGSQILFSDEDARARGVIGYHHNGDYMFINTAGSRAMHIDSSQNVGIGATTFGANMAGGMAIALGTDPTGAVADQIAFYAHNLAAGKACPGFMTEDEIVILLNQSLLDTDDVIFAGLTLSDGGSLSLQEDITFTGATTENQIKFPDNLANALSFQEAGNIYQQFITTTGSKAVYFGKSVIVNTNTGAEPFYITRFGALNESLSITIDDRQAIFQIEQDETSGDLYGGYLFVLDDDGTTIPWFRIQAKSYITTINKGGDLFHVSSTGNAFIKGDLGVGYAAPAHTISVPANSSYGWLSNQGEADSRRWQIWTDLAAYGDFAIGQSTTQNGTTYSRKLYISKDGSIGFSTFAFGANQAGGMAIALGTDPTGGVADQIAFYAHDLAGGKACPGFMTEDEVVILLNQSLLDTDDVTHADIVATGRMSSGTLTVTSANDGNIDVSGINSIVVDSETDEAVTINDFSNGVAGQMIEIAVRDNTENTTIKDESNTTGDQLIFLHDTGSDLVIEAASRGGCNLLCDGTNWYDTSHAKHV